VFKLGVGAKLWVRKSPNVDGSEGLKVLTTSNEMYALLYSRLRNEREKIIPNHLFMQAQTEDSSTYMTTPWSNDNQLQPNAPVKV
jgi:hypothetical protein